MMIAKLKLRDDGVWYCSECRVRQPCLRETCIFCDSVFTNYEEMLTGRPSLPIEDEDTDTSVSEEFRAALRQL